MPKLKILSLAVVMAAFVSGNVSLAQEATALAPQEPRVVSGNVVAVDWVASKITINAYGEDAVAQEELTFSVPEDAALMRAGEKISLSDIDQNDPVEIEFVGDPLNDPRVVSLVDTNLANAE